MTDEERKPEPEPEPEPAKGQAIPQRKRGDLQRLLNQAARQPAKQRQSAKPPPMRHQRRGR